MRSAWRGNDLKPRVYYARGPDVHFASSIIQDIFNTFVDSLSSTHRRNRFNLLDLERMTEDEVLAIYDYSSFTSTLHEIRNFTNRLADFCTGTEIEVLDGYHGIQKRDVGEILRSYNEACNISAEFDASELLSISDAIMTHNCGMLGVPGNISSCTLLHGIHLAIVLHSLQRGKVIGDDAIAIIFRDSGHTPESFIEAVAAIGRIEFTKAEFWEDNDYGSRNRWTYEKRPLERMHEMPWRGQLITWPSINILFDIVNPFHRPLRKTEAQIFQMACRQISRFQSQIFPLELSELEKSIVLSILGSFYAEHDITKLRYVGIVGEIEINGDIVAVILPPCTEDFFNITAKDFIRNRHGGTLRLPSKYVFSEYPESTAIGNEFVATPNSALNYLEKMDVLESERLDEVTLVEDLSEQDIDDFLMGRLRFKSRYTIVDYVPDWFSNILSQLFS